MRYKFCTTFLGRVKIMTRICFFLCFCWEERKVFYFIQQDYRNGGFYTIESLTDYTWKLYSSRYTDLSLNQPIKPNRPGRESYIRTLSKSSSITFSNISKPILSLFNLPKALRKHSSLSFHNHFLSLSVQSFPTHTFLPR